MPVEEKSHLKSFGLKADFERDLDGNRTIGSVIEVGIPIFDTNAAQVAKAGSPGRAALANCDAITQRALREPRVARVKLDSAARLAEQRRASVLAMCKQNLMLAEHALKSVQAEVMVLLDAQLELVEARRTLNDLEHNVALARTTLEMAWEGWVPDRRPIGGGV